MVRLRKNLLLGVVSAGFAVYGMHAGAQVGSERSNLRAPLTPVTVVSGTGPESTVEDELRRMSEQAGVIFAGEVVAVRPQDAMGAASGAASGWVEIEFKVAEAIRGCLGQGTYSLREWAGLWAGGMARYRVGEQLLMLLHTPGATGLSSPVGGGDGAIPIVGSGQAAGPSDGVVLARGRTIEAAGEQAVDLRWIEARLLRAGVSAERSSSAHVRPLALTAVRSASATGAVRTPRGMRRAMPRGQRGVQVVDTLQGSAISGGAVTSSAGTSTGTGASAAELTQGSTLHAVLAMLGTWEVQQAHASR